MNLPSVTGLNYLDTVTTIVNNLLSSQLNPIETQIKDLNDIVSNQDISLKGNKSDLFIYCLEHQFEIILTPIIWIKIWIRPSLLMQEVGNSFWRLNITNGLRFNYVYIFTAISSSLNNQVTNLEAQIKLLSGLENDLQQKQTETDALISKPIIWMISFKFNLLSLLYICCLLLALFTQEEGKKVTTIQNSLSDLYNITSTQNDQITSKLLPKLIIWHSPNGIMIAFHQVWKMTFQQSTRTWALCNKEFKIFLTIWIIKTLRFKVISHFIIFLISSNFISPIQAMGQTISDNSNYVNAQLLSIYCLLFYIAYWAELDHFSKSPKVFPIISLAVSTVF